MCEAGWHWAASSAAGFVLTGTARPLCSIAYEARECAARRAFLRAADRLFSETDHCRRIALTYQVGRALRDGRCRHNTTASPAG